MISVGALWPAILEARRWLRQNSEGPTRHAGWRLYKGEADDWSFEASECAVQWTLTDSLVTCDLATPMPGSWWAELGLCARYIDVLWQQRAAEHRRPRTVASFAQSLDGYIATREGDSKWIGNDANRVHSHRLRALHDGILVGCRTLVLDQPQLTVRKVDGDHPLRIVVTRQRQLPEQFISGISRPTLVIKPADSSDDVTEIDGLVEICAISKTLEDDYVCPLSILSALAERGIRSLMIEGGGVTVSLFRRFNALDEADIHIAPLLLGAGVRPLLVSPVDSIASTALHTSTVLALGDQAMMSIKFD